MVRSPITSEMTYCKIMELSDESLIASFIEGDSKAFEALALRHQRRVFNICYKMLGSIEEAKDASQEVLISLISKLSGFRGTSSFTTWLYRLTTNSCIDRLRRKSPDLMDPHIIDGESLLWQQDGPQPEASAIANCTRGEITLAFKSLPVDFRTAVILRDIEGLSHKEIAEIQGTNEGTVKSRISRGRRLLAERLLAGRERDGDFIRHSK